MTQIQHVPREVLAIILRNAVDGECFACLPHEVCKEWNAVFSPDSVDGLYLPWVLSATTTAHPATPRERAMFYDSLRALVLSAGAGKRRACETVLEGHIYKNVSSEPDLEFFEARVMEAAIRGGHRDVYDAVRTARHSRKKKKMGKIAGGGGGDGGEGVVDPISLYSIYRGLQDAIRSSDSRISACAFRILTTELRLATMYPDTFASHAPASARFTLMYNATILCADMLSSSTSASSLSSRDWSDFTCAVAALGDRFMDETSRLRLLDVSLKTKNRDMVSLSLRHLVPASSEGGDDGNDMLIFEMWIYYLVVKERVDLVDRATETDVFLGVPHVRAAIERAARRVRQSSGVLSVRHNPLLVACGTVGNGVETWRYLLSIVNVRHERRKRRTAHDATESQLSALMEEAIDAAFIVLDATLTREKDTENIENVLAGFVWARRILKTMTRSKDTASSLVSWTLLREKDSGLFKGRENIVTYSSLTDFHRRRIVLHLLTKGDYEDAVRLLARVGDANLLHVVLNVARNDRNGEDDVDMANMTAIAFAESLYLSRKDGDLSRTAICESMHRRMREFNHCVSQSGHVKNALSVIVRAGSTTALDFVMDVVGSTGGRVCEHTRSLVLDCFRAAMASTSSEFFGGVVRDIARGALRRVLVREGRSEARDIDVALEIERTMWSHHMKVDTPPKATLFVMGLIAEHWHPATDFFPVVKRALICAAKIGNGALVRSLAERIRVDLEPEVLDHVVDKLLMRDDCETVEVLLKRFPPRASSLLKFQDRSLEQGNVHTSKVLRSFYKSVDVSV